MIRWQYFGTESSGSDIDEPSELLVLILWPLFTGALDSGHGWIQVNENLLGLATMP